MSNQDDMTNPPDTSSERWKIRWYGGFSPSEGRLWSSDMPDLFVHRVTFDGDVEESRFLNKAKPKKGERVLVRIGNTGGKDVLAPFVITQIRDLGDRTVFVLAEAPTARIAPTAPSPA